MKSYKDLKADQLQARKDGSKTKAIFLSTLIGEIDVTFTRKGESKDIDEVTVKVATKFKKNIEETRRLAGENEANGLELVWISNFVPRKMGLVEISSLVHSLVAEHGKNMRVIMPILKGVDDMDMKIASNILKSM